MDDQKKKDVEVLNAIKNRNAFDEIGYSGPPGTLHGYRRS